MKELKDCHASINKSPSAKAGSKFLDFRPLTISEQFYPPGTTIVVLVHQLLLNCVEKSLAFLRLSWVT